MAKMNKKWVALCSTAIGAIYAAGYFTTESQASVQQPPQVQAYSEASVATVGQSAPAATTTPTAPTGATVATTPTFRAAPAAQGVTATPTVPTAPTASSGKSDKAQSKYKNGTFHGTGSNRRGSIQVAVKIQNDKITDVEISNFAMHYSEDDVVGLPQEVVRLQNAQVRNVSGATYSTEAFKDAVQNALSQARNA